MEHCPYPQNPRYPKIKIPYLEHPAFDGGAFAGYPSRQKWDRREFISGELKNGPPEKAAAFLQTWLFFGLATSILGDGIPDAKEFFIRPDPDAKDKFVLSTEGLNGVLEAWADKLMDLPEDEIWKTLRHAGDCLDEAALFSRAMEFNKEVPGVFRLDEHFPEVRLSIMILGDHLWTSLRAVENEMRGRVHIAAKAVTNVVGKKSYLGKMVGKLEKTATKALQSKNKFNFNYPAANPMPFEKQTLAPDHDYEWGKAFFAEMVGTDAFNQGRPAVGWPSWGNSRLLRERLRDSGWCMYEAERLQDIMSPWAVHYATGISWWPMLNIGEPGPLVAAPAIGNAEEEALLPPDADLPLLEHKGCTERFCTAHNIDEATYKTRHVKKDCGCNFVGLPEADVRALFDEPIEKFPLIEATLDIETNEVTMAVAPGGAGEMRYIALSHVWSHGLGNAKANTLPKCQIARLIKILYNNATLKNFKTVMANTDLVRRKENKITAWMWIDTICVPLEPEYRKLAIRRMSRVYGTCSFLWVLDLSLLPISLGQCSSIEALIRVYCSTWMQRMWTLQEGAAMNTRIVFADGLVGMINMSHDLYTRPGQPIARRGAFFDLMTQMMNSAYRPLEPDKVTDIMNRWKTGDQILAADCNRQTCIWNGLAWRSSTKASDQPLILAALVFGKFKFKLKTSSAKDEVMKGPSNIYQLSAEKIGRIVASKSSERWLTFYKEHEACPQGIMFVNCPTLPDPGFRWAPCEIGTTDRTITDVTPAKVTPTGLLVKLPGYKLLSLPSGSGGGFDFVDTTRREWFHVRPMRDGEVLDDVKPATAFDFYAIILGTYATTYEDVPGVLVTTEGTQAKSGTELNVTFGRKVFVKRKLSEEEADLNASATEIPLSVVRSERYEDTQSWCVG